jgi:hypothetical protein
MPLQIRQEQINALAKVPEEGFRVSLCQFARENLGISVASLSDEELLWRVKSGLARARSHGFRWQSSIATFVMLMLRFAPNFDEYPPVRAIIESTGGGDQELRAGRLLTEISGEEWGEVEDRYDPLAWYEFGMGTGASGTEGPQP